MATLVYANAGYNGAALSDQLACTTANTGASAVNAGSVFGGSTAKWVASTQFGGSWAIECTNTSGNPATLRFGYATPATTVSYAFDLVMPALPDSGSSTILTQRISSAVVVHFQVQTNGQFNVLAGIPGSSAAMPAPVPPSGTGTPAAIVGGNKYRIEMLVTGSTTTNTGTVAVYLFNYGAATTDYIGRTTSSPVVLAAAGSTATSPIAASDAGMGSSTLVRTIRFSNVRMTDGAASLQGPYVAATPELDFTVTVTPQTLAKGAVLSVVLTRVTGTGAGSAFVAGPVDWGDGTSSPAVSAPSGSATFTHNTGAQNAGDFTGQASASVS